MQPYGSYQMEISLDYLRAFIMVICLGTDLETFFYQLQNDIKSYQSTNEMYQDAVLNGSYY